MTTNPDVTDRAEDDRPGAEPTGSPKDLLAGHRKAWIIGATLLGATLVGWFLLAWLALGRVGWDALGESVGVGFLVLLVVTLVSAVRSRR